MLVELFFGSVLSFICLAAIAFVIVSIINYKEYKDEYDN